MTFPPIVTPKMERERLDAAPAEPTEAENPCESKQAAKAAVLGCAEVAAPAPEEDAASLFEGELVVPRLATDGAFEPPHPAATRASSVSTEPSARASFIESRKADGSKTALKQL